MQRTLGVFLTVCWFILLFFIRLPGRRDYAIPEISPVSKMEEGQKIRNSVTKGRSFRFTSDQEDIPLAEDLLHSEGFSGEPILSLEWARQTVSRPFPLGSSLASHFGYLYIQDQSSLLPPLCLAPEPGGMVLDMCASPGGKSGILSLLVEDTGLVVANEPTPSRYETLRRTVHQQNLYNVVTCKYRGQDLPFPDGFFRSILLDAPCSGWGTAEKNPSVLTIWKEEKLKPLIRLQQELLAKAAALLAPGGRLVYSTCTTNPEENESQVEWALKHCNLEPEEMDRIPGISSEAGGMGFVRIPQQPGSQGFFISKFKKLGESAPSRPDELFRFKPLAESRLGDEVSLERIPPGHPARYGSNVFFLPTRATENFPADLRWKGSFLGRMHGGNFHIDPRARRVLPRPPQKESVILTRPEDVRLLLSGQRLKVPKDQGWRGLYYKELPLGWLTAKRKDRLWSGR